MTENFLLETIADNPYQPRTVDNTEHIEKLAEQMDAEIDAAVSAETPSKK